MKPVEKKKVKQSGRSYNSFKKMIIKLIKL